MSYISEFSVDLSTSADQRVTVETTIPPTSFYTRFGKRFLDILVVILIAPIVLPLVLLCALAIRADGGPAFFLQKRLGRGGRVFPIVKLRTMCVGAEARLQDYIDTNPDARREWEINQKLKTDPRITRIGRFLRSTSLDELPQFLNVVAGDMRIIGPRPFPFYHLAAMDQGFRVRRSSVMPGVTGLWQISERSEADVERQQRLDEYYLDHRSVWFDVEILFGTMLAVFRRNGAF